MPVYVTDKPLNLTSHDVVARARRLLHTKRVGHTGTLDPLATGVLVLCVNDSTKLVQFMEQDSKDYLAYISLGAGTPTLDAEGPISETGEVPTLDAEQVQAVLNGFQGPRMQVPPQYSAIQVNGQRAYAAARAGEHIELPARQVALHELTLLGLYDSVQEASRTFAPDTEGRWQVAETGFAFGLPPALGEFPTLLVWARVGSGTYLRSLARDLGAALGVPAHLSGLVRTRAGQFGLEGAVTVEELETAPGLGDLKALSLPTIAATPDLALKLRQGKRPEWAEAGRFLVTLEGTLVAVADGDGQTLKVVRAWA
ncbi:tRNA pseudouridine(55) synthase TruB [Deinococcus radiomollis]|uniref:tRNA pseudouridine(55) synthase TruB n=1 Tax=Deinococcus radiomollis TaxID=468916 RepID=UPI0038929F3A